MPRWSAPVSVGQRYAPTDHPTMNWEVLKVFTGTDHREYALLAMVSDRSRQKTVSCAAITDSRLYRVVRAADDLD